MSEAKKNLLDANVLLRYLLQDDPELYTRSFDLMEQVRTGEVKAVILDAVLCECAYVLLKIYNVERAVIADRLRDLVNYKGIQSGEKETLLEALRLFRESGLSIVDCLLCATARREGWKLATFDEKLARRSRRTE